MTFAPFVPSLVTQQISIPTTSGELSALVASRDELRNQLEALNDQRAAVAEQLGRMGSDPAVRNAPTARLKAIDERIAKIERQIQSSDEAITTAKVKGVQGEFGITAPVLPPPNIPDVPPFTFTTEPQTWRERVLNSLEVTAPITLATVVILGALMYWRLARSFRNQMARLQADQTGALMELQRSLDSVAVEIERVSENQRFVTKLVGEKVPEKRS